MDMNTGGKETSVSAKEEMAFQAFTKESKAVYVEIESGIIMQTDAMKESFLAQEKDQPSEEELEHLHTACEMRASRHHMMENIAALVVHVRHLTKQNQEQQQVIQLLAESINQDPKALRVVPDA